MTTIKARFFISSLLIVSTLFPTNPFLPMVQAAAPPTVGMTGLVLTGNYQSVNGQPTGVATFNNGNVGAYPEGSCIPALVEVQNRDNANAADIDLQMIFDYTKNGNITDAIGITNLEAISSNISGDIKSLIDNLNDFTFTGNDFNTVNQFDSTSGSVSATVSGPFGGESGTSATSNVDTARHYNVTLTAVPADSTVTILLCNRLGVDASEFPGSSLSARASGGNGNGGGGNMPIQGGELLQLPALTITKTVVGGTATSDQWSFNVSPSINGTNNYAIPSGSSSVTIQNISPDGDYTITENLGPDGYSFSTGQGTNCAFQGSTATASLAAAKPAANATCTFTNSYTVLPPFVATTSTITIIEQVINDDGGTATAPDFTLNLTASSTNQTVPGNASGTTFIVPAGSYSVTDNSLVPNYTVGYSMDCTGTLVAGQTATCTVTHNDIAIIIPPGATTSTLTVIKRVINDNNGISTADDFTLSLTASGTQMDFPGNASGTLFVLEAGAYSVTEGSYDGYSASFTDGCSGTLTAGEPRVCTVTNDDSTPNGGGNNFEFTTSTITVVKNVINDNDGDSIAEDFTLTLNTSSTNPLIFSGNASGTSHVINAGQYYVTEESAEGYNATFSDACSGTAPAGQSILCTVTNDDVAPLMEATTGTIVVVKQIETRYGHTAKPSDFRMNATFVLPEQNNEETASTTTVAFPGNASGTRMTAGPGSYSISEVSDSNWRASYSEGCTGTLAAGETVTCTITNYDLPGTSGGSTDGSTLGGGGTGGSSVPSSPASNPTPAPRVLGAEDTTPSLCVLTELEALYVIPDVQSMLVHLGVNRDLTKEEYYNRVLVPRVVPKNIDSSLLASVQNFVNYGTRTNQRLGQGERAGAVNSFLAVHGHVPTNECEWQEVIRIANTKLPNELDKTREETILKTTFPDLYKRDANEDSAMDMIAKQIMAYGVRPQIRDLNAEREAIKVYQKIYHKVPTTASEWDANRAIAYSGLPNSMLAVDLTNAASRILSILVTVNLASN